MACEKKRLTGNCSHFQCPFPDESGYECVDIVASYCEVGEGCVDACEFSWSEFDEETTHKSIRKFEEHYGVV